MYIVIDTNIFFNNWFLKSPQFSLFANFCNNTRSKLLIPSVVCEEVNHKYKSESDALLTEIKKIARKCDEYALMIDIRAETPSHHDFDFQKVLSEKFDDLEVISHHDVSHDVLIAKAMNGKRPFRDREKGYRDALIWLSLIEHLKQNPHRNKIAFINNNTSDFFNTKDGKVFLHKDLLEDIEQNKIEANFLLYSSLKGFIDENIEQSVHGFNHNDFEEKYGSLLESDACEAAINYLNELPINACRELFENAGYPTSCMKSVEKASFEDIQGVEDPEILGFTKASEDCVYIEYRFNLLTVEAKLAVPSDEYFSKKADFEKYFMNIEVYDKEAYVCAYPRVYYSASIMFNTRTEQIDELSIDAAELREWR